MLQGDHARAHGREEHHDAGRDEREEGAHFFELID